MYSETLWATLLGAPLSYLGLPWQLDILMHKLPYATLCVFQLPWQLEA